jgi:phospholipase C
VNRSWSAALCVAVVLVALAGPKPARAEGDLKKVQHIIVVMQENHSFDNYFGALVYAPGSFYHSPGIFERDPEGGCREGDHRCVDGLSCAVKLDGTLSCFNSNQDDNGSQVAAFHDSRRCVVPDLDHSWAGTHEESNFLHPNDTLFRSLSNGFVRVNDKTEQLDNGESPTDDQTMAFYNQSEIPFYYNLAQNFAIDDRYFASVLGPTFPNRSYLLAATSFGHLTTSDTFSPPGGYKPVTGTILDLLDKNGISWGDYFQDAPQGAVFRPFSTTAIDPHFFPVTVFLAQAAGAPGVPPLPQVVFVDPNFGLTGVKSENDEHPPTDIQRGQAFVSQVVNTVRNGPYWKDSVILITYDEHGGFYDHVRPPHAPQGLARTPDGIFPGQCKDLSNPPASQQPGGGAECSANPLSATDTTVLDAEQLCPALAMNPTGPYPAECAAFGQLGFRVPFIAVSPFSKPHYVSHTIGDHTSLLAFIEKRFLAAKDNEVDRRPDDDDRLHLTKRDQHANTLEDLFDFDRSPSLNRALTQAAPPAVDCTP